MRAFIVLAVLLAATTANAAPIPGPGEATPAPMVTATTPADRIVATPSNETWIERLTRLRAERQGVTVWPRTGYFPHAPDARPVATLRGVLENLEVVGCTRVSRVPIRHGSPRANSARGTRATHSAQPGMSPQ